MIYYQSINQRNASLDAREARFKTFGEDDDKPHVLLQTCNRLELYGGDGDVPDAVANHLFRVASGLESALIGERAVQGQVKDAYLAARAHYRLPAPMHKLFEYALLAGKRVRNETEISRGAVSHSLAALEILTREHIDPRHARITVIGVNKLTADILRFLKNKGAELVFLANRSRRKAEALAGEIGCGVYDLADKAEFLRTTDVLISATSAPHLIVRAADVPAGRRLTIIDLAFPRDVEPALAGRPGISLYNLQDVEALVCRNIEVRQGEVAKAEEIIREEVVELQATLARRKRHITS